MRDSYPLPNSISGRGHPGNPYPLLPDTLHFLTALLDRISPEVVLEFGSGESTRMFAAWAAEHNARLVSVEHDRRWVAEIAGQLSPAQRSAVTMVHAPLRQIRRGLRRFFSYGFLDQLASDLERARLVLVDGPYISGRELVLYFVLSHSRPGTVIVIDDFRHYSVREMLLGLARSLRPPVSPAAARGANPQSGGPSNPALLLAQPSRSPRLRHRRLNEPASD